MIGPFHAFGAVPLDAFYLKRDADTVYRDALADIEAGPVHLHGSRQSGKSSLLIRARAALAEHYAVAFVDLAALDVEPNASDVQFEQRLIGTTARHLGLPASDWYEHAGRFGLTESFSRICGETGRETILIFDELDSLSTGFKRRLCRSLRALRQKHARESGSPINVSLCGVAPPLGYFNGASPRDGVESIGGRQLWLDDFPIDDATAERLRDAFTGLMDVPLEVARSLLRYGGGYPQACTWLGNVIAECGGNQRLPFDQDFDQRLRELTRDCFNPARQATQSSRLQMDTQWVLVNEAFFMAFSRLAREALDVYERVLANFMRNQIAESYLHGDPRYELLRMSGLARLSSDGRIRLRCSLFADAFGPAWIGRVRRVLRPRPYGSGRSTAIDKRLLIIGTGGTIAMAQNSQGVVAPPKWRPEWHQAVEDIVASVELEECFALDSANIGPNEWSTIVRTIVRNQSEFDGVIVTHGTDTMTYTASAVAFALGRDIGFPVVFTGSQAPVDVPHGDAFANVLRAALVATQDLPEVVISFGERIFRATRTQKKDDRRLDAFESPGYPELGFVAEEVQIFHQNLLIKANPTPLTNVRAEFASGILYVSQTPGSEAEFYEQALDIAGEDGLPLCRGMIIQSLGAGNVPTRSPSFDLTRLIAKATERDIPVVLASTYPVLPANYLRYSPSQAAIQAGAIPTGNMTISAVVAKLSWILAEIDQEVRSGMLATQSRLDRVREMMGREYVGEGGLAIVDDQGGAD